MNVKALQRADRWVGIPLCFVLTLVRAVFGRAPVHNPRPRRILFVKLAEQGSTVLAYPALRRAVEIAGRDHVYFIAFKDNRFILDALQVIPEANVITVSVGGIPTFLRSMLAAIGKLRGLKFDAAVDMEFFSRGSAALTYLSGARQRVGFHPFGGAGPYRGNLMTHRLIYNPHLHTTDMFLGLVEGLLCRPSDLPTFDWQPPAILAETPQFVSAPEEVAEVRALLKRETGGEPPIILLNPNSSDLLPLRRWPTERYVELATRLLARHPEAFVAFTGAPNEAPAAEALARQVGSARCISLAGKTTMRQLITLYTVADVLVTNDSGPAHFATMTPIHVVTLFGPETPKLFAARTPRNRVLWAGIVCSPCVSAYNNRKSPCRNNVCMQSITVDQVFTETSRAFEQRLSARDVPAR